MELDGGSRPERTFRRAAAVSPPFQGIPMPDQKQFRFDLTQDQQKIIREQTGETCEALELTVEKHEGNVKPSSFRMF